MEKIIRKVSFKKGEAPKGLQRAAGYGQDTDILVNLIKDGKILRQRYSVGTIFRDRQLSVWKVRLQVKESAEKCGWKWITLSGNDPDYDHLLAWLRRKWMGIENRYDLWHPTEGF